MKQVLVASLGGSPSVITETIWALMHPHELADPRDPDRRPFIPDEVRVIATAFHDGFASLEDREKTIRERIGALYRQYGHKRPNIPPFEIVTGASGTPLTDVRTNEANDEYGDLVTRVLTGYVRDPEVRLHVSLAGGRKTMSSIDQAVTSLVARPGDEISHILVDPEGLTGCPEFWWPDQDAGRPDQTVEHRFTKKRFSTRSQDVGLGLSIVTFVPLGVAFPITRELTDLTYRKLRNYVALEVARGELILDYQARTVTYGEETVELPALQFSLLALMAVARKEGWQGVGPDGRGPNHGGWVDRDELLDAKSETFGRFELLYTGMFGGEPWQTATAMRQDNILVSVRSFVPGAGVDDPTRVERTRLKTLLGRQFQNILIRDRLLVDVARKGRNRDFRFGVSLPSERIVLRGFGPSTFKGRS